MVTMRMNALPARNDVGENTTNNMNIFQKRKKMCWKMHNNCAKMQMQGDADSIQE